MAIRKGFIRSVEAVLAIVLFLSFYNIATTNIYPEHPQADPTSSAQMLLETLDETNILSELVNNYALGELSIYLDHMLSPNTGFKIETTYFEPIVVTNNDNSEITLNLSFIRALPDLTNQHNINIYDESGNVLPINIVDNYYKVSVSVQANQTLHNETITLEGIRFTTNLSERINETSFEAFVDSEHIEMDINSISYDNNYYNATADVTLLIPHVETNELLDVVIFYATNESMRINNYPSLSQGQIMPYESLIPEKSKTCQIITQITLSPNEEQILTLSYELNTDSTRNYNDLTTETGDVSIEFNDIYIKGTLPQTSYQSSSSYNVRKSILTHNNNALINLKVWYYE